MAGPVATPIDKKLIRSHNPPETKNLKRPTPGRPVTKSQRAKLTATPARVNPPNPRLKWSRVTLAHLDATTADLHLVTYTASTKRIIDRDTLSRRGRSIHPSKSSNNHPSKSSN